MGKTKLGSHSNPISFKQALQWSRNKKRHLLLGNGFGIAWNKGTFSNYGLIGHVERSQQPQRIKRLFKQFRGADFESVMRSLERMQRVISTVYEKEGAAVAKLLSSDRRKIPGLLIAALVKKHPQSADRVSSPEYISCKEFLKHFDLKFTVNYDLLLYWAVQKLAREQKNDGFLRRNGQNKALTWRRTSSQKIFFLHGGLHIYRDGSEFVKLCYDHGRLVMQIRERIQRNDFPPIVCEGNSREKRRAIEDNVYLSEGFKRFSSISGALFILGWSMKQNDKHLIERIVSNTQLDMVFIGIGASLTKRDRERWQNLTNQVLRDTRRVHFYRRDSAHVWR